MLEGGGKGLGGGAEVALGVDGGVADRLVVEEGELLDGDFVQVEGAQIHLAHSTGLLRVNELDDLLDFILAEAGDRVQLYSELLSAFGGRASDREYVMTGYLELVLRRLLGFL